MENMTTAGVNLEADKVAISEMLEKLVEAEIKRDAETAISFFAEDAITQPSDMPQIQGLKAQHELYKTFFKMSYTSFDSKSTQFVVSASGDMAYVIGWNLFVFPGSDGDIDVKGKYLAVLKKIDGDWKVAALSFSNNQPSQ